MSAVLVSYGMDFRVTEVLRPQPGRGEVVLVRIAASGVNPPDTRIFDGAAALGTTSDGQRRISRPGFNFNHDNAGNDYVARSTCN
jgi:NADPH:quinone reductase-like Zn-dependent oxidoreductase